jgi:hypothetical protein
MKLTVAFSLCASLWFSACQTTQPRTSNRFEKADLDHNKLLSRQEVGSYVASNLFEGLDKNEDGKLTSAEWNAGGNDMTVQSFRKADVNHDRVVSENELTAAAIHSRRMDQFIEGADSNRDGSVSKPEALVYYARREGPVN